VLATFALPLVMRSGALYGPRAAPFTPTEGVLRQALLLLSCAAVLAVLRLWLPSERAAETA
jgi:hypothetical protein